MPRRILAIAGSATLALFLGVATPAKAQGPAAELPVEEPSIARLSDKFEERVYLPDLSTHLTDTRVIVVDGEAMRYLATIPSGMVGLFTANHSRNEVYVATTYLSRGTHGTRSEVVEIYDARTLTLKGEVELPPKRAQAVAYNPYFRASVDGAILYVQNITPASSVSLIDPAAKKMLSEIETAGCAGIYPAPSDPRRFSTLCGDGTALTVTVDAQGRELSRIRSKPLFDAEKDPLFIVDAPSANGAIFLSFAGMVHEVDFTGSSVRQLPPWSLVGPADRAAAWRPGGYQLLALHKASGQLFVGMHEKGREGTHKNPADEIWQFDLAKKQRVRRIPGQHAVALGVSQTDNPFLFALDATNGQLVKFNAKQGEEPLAILKAPLVEAPVSMLLP